MTNVRHGTWAAAAMALIFLSPSFVSGQQGLSVPGEAAPVLNSGDTAWLLGASAIATIAPLTAVAAALLRRFRGRLTGFFAACAIGAVVIYTPIVLLGFLLQWPPWRRANDILSTLATFAAVAFIVLGLTWFITALLARIARFPRAA